MKFVVTGLLPFLVLALPLTGVAKTNLPPTAVLTITQPDSLNPRKIHLSSSGSNDPDGTIKTLQFELPGKATAKGPEADYLATTEGAITFKLKVTDNQGKSTEVSKQVTINSLANLAPGKTVFSEVLSAGKGGDAKFQRNFALSTQDASRLFVLTLSLQDVANPYIPRWCMKRSLELEKCNALRKKAPGLWSFNVELNDHKVARSKTVDLTDGPFTTVVNLRTANKLEAKVKGLGVGLSVLIQQLGPKGHPPVVDFFFSSFGSLPKTMSVNPQVSDQDGGVLQYHYDFGNGETADFDTLTRPVTTYSAYGDYPVSLTVTDESGLSTTVTKIFKAEPNASPYVVATASPSSGSAPLTVQFNGSQTFDPDGDQIIRYVWVFDDGTFSNEVAPTKTFTTVGQHQVDLVAWDSRTGVGSKRIFVYVSSTLPPIASFTATPPTGAAPLDVVFDASSSVDRDLNSAVSRAVWNFGDFTPDVEGISVSHSFTRPGSYIVTLTVFDADGDASVKSQFLTVRQSAPPIAVAGVDRASGIAPETFYFNALGSFDPDGQALTYEWTFSDGEVKAGLSVEKTFSVAGLYTATLRVTDTSGLVSAPALLSINVEANQLPVSAFDILDTPGNRNLKTLDGSASFDPDGSIVQYTWVVGNNQFLSGKVVQHSFSFGTHQVGLFVRDDKGGTHFLNKTLVVSPNQAPIGVIAVYDVPGARTQKILDASASSDADGTIDIYAWVVNGTVVSFSKIYTHTFAGPGTHTVGLYVEDNEGDSSFIQETITIPANQAPNAVISIIDKPGSSIDKTFDASQSTDSDGFISYYLWNVDNVEFFVGPQIDYSFVTAGSHNVGLYIEDNEGESHFANQTVTIANTLPIARFQSTRVNATTFSFDATSSSDSDGSIVRYEWLIDGTFRTEGANLQLDFGNFDTHFIQLTVVDNLGGTGSTSQLAGGPIQPPVANFIYTISPTNPLEVTFDASSSSDDFGIVSYTWDFGDGIPVSGQIVTHIFPGASSYPVSLTVTDVDNSQTTKLSTIHVVVPEAPFLRIVSRLPDEADYSDSENVGVKQLPSVVELTVVHNLGTINEEDIRWSIASEPERSGKTLLFDMIKPGIKDISVSFSKGPLSFNDSVTIAASEDSCLVGDDANSCLTLGGVAGRIITGSSFSLILESEGHQIAPDGAMFSATIIQAGEGGVDVLDIVSRTSTGVAFQTSALFGRLKDKFNPFSIEIRTHAADYDTVLVGRAQGLFVGNSSLALQSTEPNLEVRIENSLANIQHTVVLSGGGVTLNHLPPGTYSIQASSNLGVALGFVTLEPNSTAAVTVQPQADPSQILPLSVVSSIPETLSATASARISKKSKTATVSTTTSTQELSALTTSQWIGPTDISCCAAKYGRLSIFHSPFFPYPQIPNAYETGFDMIKQGPFVDTRALYPEIDYVGGFDDGGIQGIHSFASQSLKKDSPKFTSHPDLNRSLFPPGSTIPIECKGLSSSWLSSLEVNQDEFDSVVSLGGFSAPADAWTTEMSSRWINSNIGRISKPVTYDVFAILYEKKTDGSIGKKETVKLDPRGLSTDSLKGNYTPHPYAIYFNLIWEITRYDIHYPFRDRFNDSATVQYSLPIPSSWHSYEYQILVHPSSEPFQSGLLAMDPRALAEPTTCEPGNAFCSPPGTDDGTRIIGSVNRLECRVSNIPRIEVHELKVPKSVTDSIDNQIRGNTAWTLLNTKPVDAQMTATAKPTPPPALKQAWARSSATKMMERVNKDRLFPTSIDLDESEHSNQFTNGLSGDAAIKDPYHLHFDPVILFHNIDRIESFEVFASAEPQFDQTKATSVFSANLTQHPQLFASLPRQSSPTPFQISLDGSLSHQLIAAVASSAVQQARDKVYLFVFVTARDLQGNLVSNLTTRDFGTNQPMRIAFTISHDAKPLVKDTNAQSGLYSGHATAYAQKSLLDFVSKILSTRSATIEPTDVFLNDGSLPFGQKMKAHESHKLGMTQDIRTFGNHGDTVGHYDRFYSLNSRKLDDVITVWRYLKDLKAAGIPSEAECKDGPITPCSEAVTREKCIAAIPAIAPQPASCIPAQAEETLAILRLHDWLNSNRKAVSALDGEVSSNPTVSRFRLFVSTGESNYGRLNCASNRIPTSCVALTGERWYLKLLRTGTLPDDTVLVRYSEAEKTALSSRIVTFRDVESGHYDHYHIQWK